MIQGIKQDLNLNRQKGFYLISSNSTGLKVGTRRQVDSLFWQKQNPPNLFPFDWIFEKVESHRESSLVEIGVMCATASSW